MVISMIVWKKICLVGAIVIAAGAAVICTSDKGLLSKGNELSQPNYIHNSNMANTKIGGRDTTTTVLDAAKIQGVSYDSTYEERIRAVLKQKWGHKRYYKDFVSRIRSMTLQEGGIYGCKEVYVSTIPVFGYDPVAEEVHYGAPWILIFSTDYQKSAAVRLSQTIGSYCVSEFEEECSDELMDIFMGDEKDAIIPISGRYGEYWLMSDNSISDRHNPPEFEIKGDLYQKLLQSEIAISKEKILEGEMIKISL